MCVCAFLDLRSHQNHLQDYQNRRQEHQNRLQDHQNHTYKERPSGRGLLIGVLLMVLEAIVVVLGVVLVLLEMVLAVLGGLGL